MQCESGFQTLALGMKDLQMGPVEVSLGSEERCDEDLKVWLGNSGALWSVGVRHT